MSGFLKKPLCNAYALLRSVSIAVRAMYSISTLRVKPLTVLRSFLAAWRTSSASSAVQRMRMADLSVGMWRVQRTNLRQDSAGSPAKANGSCTFFEELTFCFGTEKMPGCTTLGERFCVSRKCSVRGYPGGKEISARGGIWQGDFGLGKRPPLINLAA